MFVKSQGLLVVLVAILLGRLCYDVDGFLKCRAGCHYYRLLSNPGNAENWFVINIFYSSKEFMNHQQGRAILLQSLFPLLIRRQSAHLKLHELLDDGRLRLIAE